MADKPVKELGPKLPVVRSFLSSRTSCSNPNMISQAIKPVNIYENEGGSNS